MLRPGPGMAHTGREMKSPTVFAALASLAAGLSFSENPKFKPAKLLEYAQSAEATRVYFCFEAASPDRLLIGYSAPRKGWGSFVGKTLPVSYDDREIQVRRPRARTLRLTQDYLTRAFATASPCGQVVEHARERLNAPPKTLRTRSITQSTPW